jgi:hypothetical protein
LDTLNIQYARAGRKGPRRAILEADFPDAVSPMGDISNPRLTS